MKTHLSFRTAAITMLLAVAGWANAQDNTATTTINIILADDISIDAGSAAAGGTVDFKYTTAADYHQTQHKEVKNSLIVTSTKSFDIKVKANGTHFVSGDDKIPVNVLQVKVVPGGTMTGNAREISLSPEDQVLVSGAGFGAQRSLHVNYSVPAEKAQKDLLGNPRGSYAQTITYTATAK